MIIPDPTSFATPKPVCLVIEADADLQLVIQYALLNEAPRLKTLYAVSSAEALEWLGQAQARRPDLVLLMGEGPSALVDWSLLGTIKQRWPHLPVLVFGGPGLGVADVNQAYQLGATWLLTKPASLVEWETLLPIVVNFWLLVARLPGHFYPFQ